MRTLNSGHSNWTIIRSDFNCAEECPGGGPCEIGCGQPGSPKPGALCCSGHRGSHPACTDDVSDAINIRHESDEYRCIRPIEKGNHKVQRISLSMTSHISLSYTDVRKILK